MSSSKNLLATAMILTFALVASSQVSPPIVGGSDVYLDVGNDTDYEFASNIWAGPLRIELSEDVNRYVRGGCWCVGCVLDAESGNCSVPIILTSNIIGNLTVDGIKIEYTKSRTIGDVGYGMPFRSSDGGCWSIQHLGGVTPVIPIPSDYNGGDCTDEIVEVFQYTQGQTEIATDDAAVDAVYRLLNGTLDNVEGVVDGVIDVDYNPENMSFETEGEIGVQTLWGPLQMRLILWS